MRRVLLATPVAVAAMLACATAAPAQAPGPQTLTFKEINKGSSFHFIDNPPKSRRGSFSVGDMFVFRTPLRSDAGRPFGVLRATCFITRSGRRGEPPADCLGVYSLPAGQLWATASTGHTTTRGVIMGGTGAYANMHGTFVSKTTKSGANDTVTLVGG